MFVTLSVIARIVSNSVANLYQKKASEKDSALSVNLASYFVMSVLCLPFAFIVDWSVFGASFWVIVVSAGLLCTIGTLALIEALRIGELSVLAPINSYKSIVGLIGAFILLGEIPSLKEFVCVIFIVFGSFFVLSESGRCFSFELFFRRDVRLRFFALLCSGIEASLLKKIIIMSDFRIALILWCFSGFVCSAAVCLAKFKMSEISVDKKNYFNCCLIGFCLVLMQLSTNYVFLKIPVGPALALFQLSSLLSVYLGYKVFKEKNMMRKILGTIIMLTASVFILIGG